MITDTAKTIQDFIDDGLDPGAYRKGIARICGVAVSVVDAAIAETTLPDAEQRKGRMADAAECRSYQIDYRAHDEDDGDGTRW